MHIISPIIELIIITVMINYVLSFFWNTRSRDLVIGVAALLLLYIISYFLSFPILEKIMHLIAGFAVIALIIIFQQELRVALSKLTWKGKRHRDQTEFDKFLDQLATAVYRLADKRVGAIIVLENQDHLDEYCRHSVPLDAKFTVELIETIFNNLSVVHDGAVVIRETTILACSVILPLPDVTTAVVQRSLGTRHRAAIGISTRTDCISIVVSEERGSVSIVIDGIMLRAIKIDRMKGIIRNILGGKSDRQVGKKFNLWEWMKS